MYLSHNNFDPVGVLKAIAARLDTPDLTMNQVGVFLTQWFGDWLEGDIDESDELWGLFFGDLNIAGIEGVTVVPLAHQQVPWESSDGMRTHFPFPLILVEYYNDPKCI